MNTHRHHRAQIDTRFTLVANASPFSVAAKLDTFITWAGASDELREATVAQLWAPAVSAVTIPAIYDDDNWSDDLVGGLSIEGAREPDRTAQPEVIGGSRLSHSPVGIRGVAGIDASPISDHPCVRTMRYQSGS